MNILLILLCLAMLPMFLIGLLIFVKVIVLPMKAPADTSNRIAHACLVWFAIDKPQEFVDKCPWLTKDEHQIVG